MINEEKTNDVGKKPIYKKWWFWVIIVIVLSAVIGVSVSHIGNTDDISGKTHVDAEMKNENSDNTSRQPATHLYDKADAVEILSDAEPPNEDICDWDNVIGEYSVIRTNSDEVTDERLADWYFNYVINEDNEFEWYMILFTDKSDHSGIYATDGLIKKNVIFEQNEHGDYIRNRDLFGEDTLGKPTNSTVYYVSTNEGTLISSDMFVEQARVAVQDAISRKDESIIDVVYRDGDLCVYVDFTKKNLSPSALEELAFSRTYSITETVLELKQYSIFWETITVDFGETGHITNPKENVAMDENGRGFLIAMSDLE